MASGSVSFNPLVGIAGLSDGIEECWERRLYFASKWATELYASFSAAQKTLTNSHNPITPLTSTPTKPPSSFFKGRNLKLSSDSQGEDSDLIRVAQTYFDNKQLYRVGHVLRDCTSAKARFLRCYSQFLASEKKAIATWNGLDGSRDQPPTPVNTEIREILEDIGESSDAFLLFLRGVILARLNKPMDAAKELIKSVNIQPWNWSAWLQLVRCYESREEITASKSLLPSHMMSQIFFLRIGIEMHTPSQEDIGTIDKLLHEFPESPYLLSQKAQLCFQQKDWVSAEQIWEHVLKIDPYRIDDIDQYSNMLFIMRRKEKLFRLAHDYLAVDPSRPEVLSLIGNYYSMMDEHDKAIKYLRRATQLDRYYKSAWTLIGHEYVYIKNYQAAIEAYRRAVDTSKIDYRAWYGLGRAYDGLSMPTYAMNYYRRALALYPYDAGLWQAVGSVLLSLNKLSPAANCLKLALTGASPDHPTEGDKNLYLQLATIYDRLGEGFEDEAVEYHRRAVTFCRKLGKPVAEYARSCTYIARYHIAAATESLREHSTTPSTLADKTAPNVLLARQYLEMLIADDSSKGNVGAEEINMAKEMLRKLESVKL